jgi:hypothetical protein
VMMEQPQRFNESLLKVISTFVGGGHRGGHETTCGS